MRPTHNVQRKVTGSQNYFNFDPGVPKDLTRQNNIFANHIFLSNENSSLWMTETIGCFRPKCHQTEC